MPAATNKAELIAVTNKEYDKLSALLEGMDEETALWVNEDDFSVRDIIAHRGHWVGLYLSWYEDGCNGLDVKTPAPGYKWNQLKAYNGIVREASRAFDWEAILAAFARKHAALLAHLDALEDDVLYEKHLYPWMNDWFLGRWAESAGASHYRSAAKVIRALKRKQAAT